MESFGGAGKRDRPDGATGNGGLAGSKLSREAVAMAAWIPPPQPAAKSCGASAITHIPVDASLAGDIMRRGGTNIRQVTGAKLSIRDNESDANLKDIKLEGTFNQILLAHAMVQELIMNIGASNPPPPVKQAAPASGC